MNRRDSLFIGLDVGSGSAKASVFTLDGQHVNTASSSYAPSTPNPGIAEYDPHEVQNAAVTALADAVRDLAAGSVQAIAVDAMISGAVAVDVTGRPISSYTTTLDTRFSGYLDNVLAAGGARLRHLSGSGQPTLAPKIHWMRREIDGVDERAAKYVLAGSLVVSKLAGLDADEAFIDETCLWATGLADCARREWSQELCNLFEIDMAVLPRILASTEVVGGLTAEIAARCNLTSGIPVIAGCGDQSAGFVGAGAARLGAGADSAGTYSVVAGVTREFVVLPDADAPDVLPVASGVGFNLQSMVIGGGLTRQWAARLLGDVEVGAELLESEPGSRGVRFVPHLGGQAYPARPNLRGAWIGLTWAHEPIDMYQAVLEGVALSNANAFVRMRELYADVHLDSITVFGGGARSAAWNQIKADAAGVRYESLGDLPATSLGAAMLAAQGIGQIDDATQRCADVRTVQRIFEPNERRHQLYSALAAEHTELVASVANL